MVKKRKNKTKYIVIATILIIFVIGIIIYYYIFKPVKIGKHIPVELNKENLPSYLENLNVIENIPKKTDVQLNFGETEYNIKGKDVNQGETENPDFVISLPESYIDKIGEKGICEAVQEAIEKNEITIETTLSGTELFWKYKGLLKYKDCIGL